RSPWEEEASPLPVGGVGDGRGDRGVRLNPFPVLDFGLVRSPHKRLEETLGPLYETRPPLSSPLFGTPDHHPRLLQRATPQSPHRLPGADSTRGSRSSTRSVSCSPDPSSRQPCSFLEPGPRGTAPRARLSPLHP